MNNVLCPIEGLISWIYTPGNNPKRFTNSKIPATTGTILDLEDAVPPDAKNSARENIVNFLSHNHVCNRVLAVRINGTDTDYSALDLQALVTYEHTIYIVLPKIERIDDINVVTQILPHARVIVMIESAKGISNLNAFLTHSAVVGVMFGAADFASDLDACGDWSSLLLARQMLILYSKAYDLPVWDSPYFDLENTTGLYTETQLARNLGFTGKIAIHPSQIGIIETIFTPTDEQIAWAHDVVNMINSGLGIAVVRGKFIDKAMLKKAHSILRRE